MPRYRLGSSPLINAPGIVAWAINGYAFERDRPILLRVIAEGWASVPERHIALLLSRAVPYVLDGDTVVFTVADADPDPPLRDACYEGNRRGGDYVVTAFDAAGAIVALDPRLDLRNHSPTGLAWGYAGSGPAQLALALLAHALADDARALELYQRFKHAVIVRLGESWRLTATELLDHVRRLEEEPDGEE